MGSKKVSMAAGLCDNPKIWCICRPWLSRADSQQCQVLLRLDIRPSLYGVSSHSGGERCRSNADLLTVPSLPSMKAGILPFRRCVQIL